MPVKEIIVSKPEIMLDVVQVGSTTPHETIISCIRKASYYDLHEGEVITRYVLPTENNDYLNIRSIKPITDREAVKVMEKALTETKDTPKLINWDNGLYGYKIEKLSA